MQVARVQDIREYFYDQLKKQNFVTDKTGVKTIELIGANFIANEPTIFGEVNEDYIRKELAWYKSMSLNVNDLEDTPAIWKKVADEDGYINSNYGWCIWSHDNHYQYHNALNELNKNPDSRRAIMIYTRPSMWHDYDYHGMSDFMCTNTVQYLIRDNRLNAVVQMRSNDVVYGYRNDYAWQDYVLDKMANELKVARGDIYWNVGSLHVYERHFDLVI